MNHCVLEVEVMQAPTLRYTQDNQTPIAEMEVRFDGLRPDDPPSELKVVGWGNLAQDLQNRVQPGQRLLIEGRLRMNTVPRQDGTKEKRAEFTLARATIAVGILPGLDHRLFGDAIHLAPGAVVALGFLQDFLVPRTGGHTAFYSCHFLTSLKRTATDA